MTFEHIDQRQRLNTLIY